MAIPSGNAKAWALAEQLAAARAQRWLDENGNAIQSSNQYVETKGLPLARYRQF